MPFAGAGLLYLQTESFHSGQPAATLPLPTEFASRVGNFFTSGKQIACVLVLALTPRLWQCRRNQPARYVNDRDGTHPRPPAGPVIDGIDSSSWLPRDASVVKPERIAKGDMEVTIRDGRIAAAQVIDRSLLGELITRGVLDEHHHYYAAVFLDMRRYFRRAVGYSGNPIYAKEFLSVSNSGILETLYLRVCRLIGRDHERTVMICLETAVFPDADGLAEMNRVLVLIAPQARLAFDALVRSIDQARKEVEEE